MKLSDALIRRLNKARFNVVSAFEERFKDFMDFKAIHRNCDVSRTVHEYASLGRWCCEMRYSYKRMQNNQKPRRAKLSDKDIQRLVNDAGFRWCSRARRGRQSSHRRTQMNQPLPLLAIRQRPVSGKWKIRAVTQRQQITATASSKSELQVQSQNYFCL